MLSSNDSKETKQFDKIASTDENKKILKMYWTSKNFFDLYDTFEKCSQERDLYSIKFAVDNGIRVCPHAIVE